MVVVPGRRLGDIVEAAVSKQRSCNNSARYPGEGEGGKEEERKRVREKVSVPEGRKEERIISKRENALRRISGRVGSSNMATEVSRPLSLSRSRNERYRNYSPTINRDVVARRVPSAFGILLRSSTFLISKLERERERKLQSCSKIVGEGELLRACLDCCWRAKRIS